MQPPRSSHTFDLCNSHLIPMIFHFFSFYVHVYSFHAICCLSIWYSPMLSSSAVGHCDIAILGWEIPIINGEMTKSSTQLRTIWLQDDKIKLLYDYMTPIQHYKMIEYDYFMIMIWLWWFSGHFQPWFDATHQAVSGAVSQKPCRGSGDDDFDVDSEDLDGELIDALLEVIGAGHGWSCGVVGVRFGSCIYIYIWYLCVCMSFAKD